MLISVVRRNYGHKPLKAREILKNLRKDENSLKKRYKSFKIREIQLTYTNVSKTLYRV